MSQPVAKKERDIRLDFFRGLGMFIIFIAHTPGNPWTLWIPARFGFSDATEIFVFCSGMASAIAFGAVFDRSGWVMGVARVSHRIWQVYWAHVVLFLVILAMLLVIDDVFATDGAFVKYLNLLPFLNNTGPQLVGLLTLTYVPNYFDILPMYIVILMLLPVVMGLAAIHPGLAGAFIVGLWLLATFEVVDFPAEPWSERAWFFNPLGWQLVFFTGFAFMRGWLPAPPIRRDLMIAAAVIVLVVVPFAYFRLYNAVPEFKEMRGLIRPLIEKSDFGLFRYLHFLALAYLAYALAGPKGANLPTTGLLGRVADLVRLVGQQSLAVFLASLVVAQSMGAILYFQGRDMLTVTFVNLLGFALLVAVAKIAAWYKSQPWRRREPSPSGGTAVASGGGAGAVDTGRQGAGAMPVPGAPEGR